MGRNKDLIVARDHKIFDRYIYWTEVRRLRFDDAVKILSQDEFFVSEFVVLSVVRKAVREGWKSQTGKSPTKSKFSGFRVKSETSVK